MWPGDVAFVPAASSVTPRLVRPRSGANQVLRTQAVRPHSLLRVPARVRWRPLAENASCRRVVVLREHGHGYTEIGRPGGCLTPMRVDALSAGTMRGVVILAACR
jgi:hypothetical protein